jgi:hypothetical protein
MEADAAAWMTVPEQIVYASFPCTAFPKQTCLTYVKMYSGHRQGMQQLPGFQALSMAINY